MGRCLSLTRCHRGRTKGEFGSAAIAVCERHYTLDAVQLEGNLKIVPIGRTRALGK